MSRGFTLIELMLVVTIVGILSVLSMYGVRKYMTEAKSTEARASVGQIAKGAVAAYYYERSSTTAVSLGGSAAKVANSICASTPSWTPSSISAIANRKYQSRPSDWRNPSWNCLGFSMTDPQYYAYAFLKLGSQFRAQALGDLNGNGVFSMFQLYGGVDAGQIRIAPAMIEIDPDE